MVKVAPSILASDLLNLKRTLTLLEEAEVSLLHIDVMDGHFVPNITFGVDFVSAIKRETHIPLDVHLMVEDPEKVWTQFVEAGASYLSFHLEATRHPQRLLESIRGSAKAGLVLNPATPLDQLQFLWGEFDFLLLMSVNPGFAGQKLLKQTLSKIEEAKRKIIDLNLPCELEADGGINLNNAGEVIKRGADILVLGAGIFSEPDLLKVISQLNAL